MEKKYSQLTKIKNDLSGEFMENGHHIVHQFIKYSRLLQVEEKVAQAETYQKDLRYNFQTCREVQYILCNQIESNSYIYKSMESTAGPEGAPVTSDVQTWRNYDLSQSNPIFTFPFQRAVYLMISVCRAAGRWAKNKFHTRWQSSNTVRAQTFQN